MQTHKVANLFDLIWSTTCCVGSGHPWTWWEEHLASECIRHVPMSSDDRLQGDFRKSTANLSVEIHVWIIWIIIFSSLLESMPCTRFIFFQQSQPQHQHKETYPKNPTPKNKNNKTNKRTFSPFSFGISLRIHARKKKIFKTPAQNAHGGERSHPMSSWSSVGYSNLGDSWAFESCPFQGLSGLL